MFNTGHLHPAIVHFPIALITVGFLADVCFIFFKSEKCLLKTGFYLMAFGTLGALAAFITGHLFTNEPTEGDIMKVFIRHKTGALLTIIIMLVGVSVRIILVAMKKEESQFKWLVFGLYLLGVAAITFTGFMGGSMVYNFMLGI